MNSVRLAINAGVYVILTTSAEEGEVKVVYDFPGSVYDSKNTGVILGKDYSSKKARIKCAVLIAAGKTYVYTDNSIPININDMWTAPQNDFIITS